MDARAELGRWGEDLAVQHLQAAGCEVLARNWRCPQGELDVVVRDGRALVFVEVKARSGRGFGEPAEAVGPVKVRRLRRLACCWLEQNRPADVGHELRFDVVSVLRVKGTVPEVVHLKGAF